MRHALLSKLAQEHIAPLARVDEHVCLPTLHEHAVALSDVQHDDARACRARLHRELPETKREDEDDGKGERDANARHSQDLSMSGRFTSG